jgi:hypothetical protein
MRSLILLVVLVASSSYAGTLRNADPHEYRLKIKGPDGQANLPINTSTTLERTCNGFPCDIENEDTGDKVRLTNGDENLDIKNGRFAMATAGAESAATAPAPVEKPAKPAKAAKAAKAKHGKVATKAGKERHAKKLAKAKTRHARRG